MQKYLHYSDYNENTGVMGYMTWIGKASKYPFTTDRLILRGPRLKGKTISFIFDEIHSGKKQERNLHLAQEIPEANKETTCSI